MTAWPATLPQHVRRTGFQASAGEGRARSRTDVGIPKQRRRFSAVPRPFKAQMFMTTTQLATLKTFIADDTAGGTLPFTFPAQDEDGTWTVQFGQNLPSWTPVGVEWIVSLDLVILP